MDGGVGEVVDEIMDSAQSAQTTARYPRLMSYTRNTTMSWAWLKRRSEKNFGLR